MRRILFCCFLISACTVGPDFEKKDVFEDAQIAQTLKLTGKSLKISQKWYQDFHDETLNFLIAEAISANTDILIAIERLKQARSAAQIAKAEYLPMLNLKTGYDYTKASKNIGLTADTDYYLLGFDANWELDIWGKGRRLNQQKKAEFDAAYYTLQNIKNVITSEVASTYFTLLTMEQKRKISVKNLQLQKDIFKTIDEKYQAGLADESAYRQASYLVEKTKAVIPQLEAQIKAQKNALNTLLGQLDFSFKLDDHIIQNAANYKIQNLLDLPSNIIRTRPDIKAAEKALVSQNAAIGQAVAALYPNISLSGLFGFQASNLSDLVKSSSKAYGYTPTAVMPLFYWGQLKNAIKLEEEKTNEAFQNYRKTLLSGIEELSNAITSLQKEYISNLAYKNAFYNMQRAFLTMREKYDNGLIEYASLLEVQQDLLNSQISLAESNGAILNKIIAFYKATGGGYNDDE